MGLLELGCVMSRKTYGLITYLVWTRFKNSINIENQCWKRTINCDIWPGAGKAVQRPSMLLSNEPKMRACLVLSTRYFSISNYTQANVKRVHTNIRGRIEGLLTLDNDKKYRYFGKCTQDERVKQHTKQT